MSKQEAWEMYLETVFSCYADELYGNRPCDNGYLCDDCNYPQDKMDKSKTFAQFKLDHKITIEEDVPAVKYVAENVCPFCKDVDPRIKEWCNDENQYEPPCCTEFDKFMESISMKAIYKKALEQQIEIEKLMEDDDLPF